MTALTSVLTVPAMALSGSLRTLSLAEIFQTLNRSTATGVLRLSSSEGRVDVVFEEGWLIGLLHHDQGQEWSVVERLIAFGIIGPEQADQLAGSSYTSLQALIDQGLITADQADDAITNHIFDELCDLFTWDSANFVFIEGEDEAAGDDPSLTRAREHPVRIDVSSLLMESARRLDEWHRILPDLPADDAVVAIVPGRETELQTRFSDYPERPVMGMIDGVRTIGEIADQTPITHMDVHSVLYDAVCEGVIQVLSPDEMEYRARELLRLEDPARAARLLRSCLAIEPGRHAAVVALAQALQQLGDPPEAADCYATLALSYLQDDQVQDAIGAARQAVAIEPSDRIQHVLIRCLVENDDTVEAADQLLQIGQRKVAEGRLDEARGTLRQVLQLDPDNHSARHELARIMDDHSTDEDVVVCVECGGQNQRGRDECEVCKAPLFLTCLSCQRAVAISDRICVFCGADPHISSTDGRGLRRAGPSTTTLIKASDKEEAASGKHDAIRSRMAEARSYEEAERFADALEIWKALAAEQQGNARLNKHIRELQQLVHDADVEQRIERAHALRRGRRYHRALRAYVKAKQAISPEDPRAAKLDGLITATKRNSQLTTLTYGAAFAILGLVAWLVVQPIYEFRTFKAEVAAVQKELDQVLGRAEGTLGFKQVIGLVPEDWSSRAESMGPEATTLYDAVRQQVEGARLRLGRDALDDIAALLSEGDWKAADDELDFFRATFGNQVLDQERIALEDEVASRREMAAGIPERLEAIEGQIAGGQLATALASLREVKALAEGEHQEVARARITELSERLDRFEAAFEAAATASETDLENAASTLQSIRADAASWDRIDAYDHLRAKVDGARAAATAAWSQLARPYAADDLEAFVTAHPASAEAATARRELTLLGEQAERRERAIAAGVTRWREAREQGRLEEAWKAARDMHRTYPQAAADAGILIPLRLVTGVAAAELLVAGEPVAAADDDGVVTWWHQPIEADRVSLAAEDFEPLELRWSDLAREWTHDLPLERSVLWRWQGSGTIHRMAGTSAGVLAVSGRNLALIGSDGQLAWQQQVGNADELLGGLRLPSWTQFTVTDDAILAPVSAGGVRVLDWDGGTLSEIPGGTLAAPPTLYTNELLGGEPRLAMIAGGRLAIGSLDEAPKIVEGVSDCISGPTVLSSGVDRLLLVGTLAGRLVAVDDSSGAVAWRLDLMATDIGRLVPVDAERCLSVLDGSRLVAIRGGLAGGEIAWELPLGGSVVGVPQVVDGIAYITVDRGVLAVDTQRGTREQVASLPGNATASAVVYGARLYAAYESNGSYGLLCSEGGRTRWRRSLKTKSTALAVTAEAVAVGTDDGWVMALPP